jgi:hypothetical protein
MKIIIIFLNVIILQISHILYLLLQLIFRSEMAFKKIELKLIH